MSRKSKKQFIVIGLGRFGMALAKTLTELNAEVLAVDKDEENVDHAAEFSTYAVRLDATDEKALMSLGLENFDVACVCTADLNASVMITLICKEAGVGRIIAKSSSALHTKVLQRVGADQVVFPEADSGVHIAHMLVSANILDFIELSPEYGIAEFEAYCDWEGKSLSEIDFRKKYGLNVIAIRRADGAVNINPLATDVINKGDVVVAIGQESKIDEMENGCSKTGNRK